MKHDPKRDPPPRDLRAAPASGGPGAAAGAPRFDAKTAFAALSAEEQRAIGEAGLLLAAAIDGKEYLDWPSENRPATVRSFDVAESEACDLLLDAVRACELPAFAATPPPLPDLNPFGLAQCRVCGCTDNHACEGGCCWVEPDLCSSCVSDREAAH